VTTHDQLLTISRRLGAAYAREVSLRRRHYRVTANRFRRAAERARAVNDDAAGELSAAGKKPSRRRGAKRVDKDAPKVEPDQSASTAGGGSGGRGSGDDGDNGGNGNDRGMPGLGPYDHPRLTPEQHRAALAAAKAKLAQARESEPAITAAVEMAVVANGGTLKRLENRFKTEDSLYRKIQKVMVQLEVDLDFAARDVKDALRYTAELPDDGYWSAGSRIGEALEAAGITPVRRGKSWTIDGYKGRNEMYRAPDGMEFEIKIHTAASRNAEEKTYDWYKEARLPTTSPEDRAKLDAQQAAIFAAVPIPDDVRLDEGYICWLPGFRD
jgi:hypothetical protein